MSDPTRIPDPAPKPKPYPPKEFNILLVGETGVGKSTFINAFVNYLSFKTLDDALPAEKIVSFIPCRFTVTNEDLEEIPVVFGEDENESAIVGASATQAARSYKFLVGNAVIRLIDTPGLGDTRGIMKDEENFDEMLKVIGELKDLHAICIMLKPNNARLTILFEYCVKQLLSRLQRSASENICFLFTNSRSTFYRPGDTLKPLKRILEEIESNPPNVKIPFHKGNVFCMDNEAFRFLVANNKGVLFSEQEKEDFGLSWNKSAEVCLAFMDYVVNAEPHKIQDTVSINEARRLILLLSEPLAQITEAIVKNLQLLDNRKKYLEDKTKSVDDLKKDLYFTTKKVRERNVNRARTVCTELSCSSSFKNNQQQYFHYGTVCHDPCQLTEVKENSVGNHHLVNCAMMFRNFCKLCTHHYIKHMRVYYETEILSVKVENSSVRKNIDHEEKIADTLREAIRELEEKKKKYEDEKCVIQKSMAKFAHFLKNNAITVCNDKYKEYIEYLIIQHQNLGENADEKQIECYRELIRVYQEQNDVLDAALRDSKCKGENIIAAVTAEEVISAVQDLYELELNGQNIRNLFQEQRLVQEREFLTKTEREYRPPFRSSTSGGFFSEIARWFSV